MTEERLKTLERLTNEVIDELGLCKVPGCRNQRLEGGAICITHLTGTSPGWTHP